MKPGFFKNEDLAALTPMHRLCFAGLWLMADKCGRLEDRPRRIKGELFAYENVEVEPILSDLEQAGFIFRYVVKEIPLIQIVNFEKHQRPHKAEPVSKLPEQSSQDVVSPSQDVVSPSSSAKIARGLENGERRTENGDLRTGTGIRTLSSADADFERFRVAYPVSRRVGGKTGKNAFKAATAGRNGTHFAAMLGALEQQKRSEQWKTPKLIPLMTTWLNQERWNQVLPESRTTTPRESSWCQHDPLCRSEQNHRKKLSAERGERP